MRILLLLAILFAAPAAALAEPTLDEMRARALELVNHDRRRRGRKPLVRDATLEAASQEHAEDMAERRYFSHKGRDGRRARKRYLDQGGSSRVSHGENLASCRGCPAVDGARIKRFHRNLMRSRGHRVNILRRGFTRFGYGLARRQDRNGRWRIYAVQTFSSTPPAAGATAGANAMTLPTRGKVVRKRVRKKRWRLFGR